MGTQERNIMINEGNGKEAKASMNILYKAHYIII